MLEKTETDIQRLSNNLRANENAYLSLFEQLCRADGGKLFPFDHLAIAALNRSLGLVHGALRMVEDRNAIAAIPLLRMQLDTALRLFACSLFDNVHDPATHLLKGEHFGTLKVKRAKLKHKDLASGKGLEVSISDSLLHKEFSLIAEWASRVYQATSGYIHFSAAHLRGTIAKIDKEERTVEMIVAPPPDAGWRDDDVVEYLTAFSAATRQILEMVHSWANQKEEVGRVRREKATEGDPKAQQIERDFGNS